ncbi:hypothetical protein GCM10011332_13750 [Terasakiella brassicae]|uniref:Guanylate cyclase domain-containing protein n=1 Tax=Terasakiella brassicae TaxID=1634917 RepID=A0A917BXC5_9PROT|nr:adenylate/guanylate cyclase domain-containing protein [Terasakiella brassicae]GGF61177.1 hypothetical protein GCM10011332_13750 [Terasakiella brassicae]
MGTNDNQTYEVQIYISGRWQVHARYPYHERILAVREAKDLGLEKKAYPVRVVLEDYNPRTGRHEERLIYKNGISPSDVDKIAKTKRANSWANIAVSSNGRVGYLNEDIDMYLDSSEDLQTAPKAKVSAPMFLGIWLTIIGIGAGAGGAATAMLYLLIRAFDISQADSIQKFLLMGMFALVFMIAASSSYAHYTNRFDLNIFKKRIRKATPPEPTKISRDMAKAAEAIDKVKPVVILQETEKQDEEFNIFDLNPATEETAPPTQGEVELSQEAQQQKMFLINFLGTCLGALKGPDSGMENLNRFGLNMFMTGAVLRLAKDHNLRADETQVILHRIIEMLGAKPDQAQRFEEEYEKHLQHPRHLALFEASGKIAARFADGDQSAPLYIRSVMEEWVNWKPAQEMPQNPNLLTIMFTDMVGSTDLATKHGDYAAQEALRNHDLTVRTALTNFEGKEVKHLGDGIMASFQDCDLALQAAIEIQKRVEGNNNANPEFPFQLRIGLHMGEPIKKNNDLFGSAVQLAARICNKAEGNQIAISQDLKDVFGDQPVYTFMDQGLQKLKGFEQPQPIYLLDWKAPPLTYEDIHLEEVIPPQEGETDDEENFPAHLSAPVSIEGIAPDMSVHVLKPAKKQDTGFNMGFPMTPPKAKPAQTPADNAPAEPTPDKTKQAD